MTPSMTRSTTIARIMLGGVVALLLGSAALAQQALSGVVTEVNRINSTVAIRQTQSGTVGAAQSYHPDDLLPVDLGDRLHAAGL